MAGVLAGTLWSQVTAGAYYAIGNTKTPSKISVTVFSLYLPLKVFAFFAYGVLGIAVTMSAYMLTTAAVQLLFLERNINGGRMPTGYGSNTPKDALAAQRSPTQ